MNNVLDIGRLLARSDRFDAVGAVLSILFMVSILRHGHADPEPAVLLILCAVCNPVIAGVAAVASAIWLV